MTEPEAVVVDTSVVVDLLAHTEYASAAKTRLAGTVLHAPATWTPKYSPLWVGFTESAS